MKKSSIILLLLITLTAARALASDGPQAAGDSALRAGTAKVNITPATDEPIHDSIYARSLVLEANGLRIAFVSVDLAVFTSARIEKVCREKYGIRQVMLCSSHNHSEPQPQGKRSFQAGNPYTAFYEDRIIESIGEAVRTLFPARIAAEIGRAHV